MQGSATALQPRAKIKLPSMAGCTNFPLAIPFPLLFMRLIKFGNLWNFIRINSQSSQNMIYNTFIAPSNFSEIVPHKYKKYIINKKLQRGQIHEIYYH